MIQVQVIEEIHSNEDNQASHAVIDRQREPNENQQQAADKAQANKQREPKSENGRSTLLL